MARAKLDTRTARERLKALSERWYLTEPALFFVYCNFELTPNLNMSCAVRSGSGRIEYNAEIISRISDAYLSEIMKIELLRILLKHPYSRRPEGVSNSNLYVASDMSISYDYQTSNFDLYKPQDYGLESNKHYEWYCNRLKDNQFQFESDSSESDENGNSSDEPGNDSSGSYDGQDRDSESDGDSTDKKGKGNSDSSNDGNDGQCDSSQANGKSKHNGAPGSLKDKGALWSEDSEQCDKINRMIEHLSESNQWGSVPQNIVDKVIASTKSTIDYRAVLSEFRASILSDQRSLTRMRPSRRWGFEMMGSKYNFTTKLLIAVDTSGSITDESLSHFFGVIQRFFKYGIKTIDVIQFDCEIKGEPMKLDYVKRNKKEFDINGRGGTSFQPAINYIKEHKEYDGLIFFTDGEAYKPNIDFATKTKIVWVLTNKKQYYSREKWMDSIGRVCYIEY